MDPGEDYFSFMKRRQFYVTKAQIRTEKLKQLLLKSKLKSLNIDIPDSDDRRVLKWAKFLFFKVGGGNLCSYLYILFGSLPRLSETDFVTCLLQAQIWWAESTEYLKEPIKGHYMRQRRWNVIFQVTLRHSGSFSLLYQFCIAPCKNLFHSNAEVPPPLRNEIRTLFRLM